MEVRCHRAWSTVEWAVELIRAAPGSVNVLTDQRSTPHPLPAKTRYVTGAKASRGVHIVVDTLVPSARRGQQRGRSWCHNPRPAQTPSSNPAANRRLFDPAPLMCAAYAALGLRQTYPPAKSAKGNGLEGLEKLSTSTNAGGRRGSRFAPRKKRRRRHDSWSPARC